MSAETIVTKIKKDAEQKANQIKKEAEQQATTIKENATQHAQQKAKEIIDKGKQQAENRKKIIISQARQEAKREELQAKEEIIETCFQQALEKLQHLSQSEYKKIVKQLINQGKKAIPGSCTIKISNDLDKKIAKEQNIPVSGKTDASGGIILVAKNGSVTIDNTFEGILSREKQQIRVKIGTLLFGEKK